MSLDLLIKQEEVKAEILKELKKVKREGIKNLIKDLDELGYFKAPASTQYHLNYEGGLAEHSLNVCKLIQKMFKQMYPEKFDNITVENLVIVSLLHDFGKAKFYGEEEYIPNILKSGKVSESKPYKVNKQTRPAIPHSIVSVAIVSKYIELTPDELTAILFHDSLYTAMGRELLGKEIPLQQLLHYADFWCARFLEPEKQVESEE